MGLPRVIAVVSRRSDNGEEEEVVDGFGFGRNVRSGYVWNTE